MLKKNLLIKRKLLNIIQSLLIIIATGITLSIAAFFIFGFLGIIFVWILWLFTIIIIPKIDPHAIIKLYKAKKVTYNEIPQIYNSIYKLSKDAQLSTPPLLYLVGTDTFIAFSTGTKDNSAIVLSHGMIKVLDQNELTAVLAHEISHIKNNDIWIMQITDIAIKVANITAYTGQIVMAVLSPFLILDHTLYFWSLFLVFLTIPPINTLMQLSLSRVREYAADIDSALLTKEPKYLINALRKLDIIEESIFKRLFNPFKRSSNPSILRTHPSTKKRIENLSKLEKDDL